jgi:hypothetical protein
LTADKTFRIMLGRGDLQFFLPLHIKQILTHDYKGILLKWRKPRNFKASCCTDLQQKEAAGEQLTKQYHK